MKKLLLLCLLTLVLTACSDTPDEPATIADNVAGVESMLPNAKFEELEANRYSSTINENIFYFAETNTDGAVIKLSAAATTNDFAGDLPLIQSTFTDLVKSADSNLNDTQINKLFTDLAITWDDAMLDATKVKTLGDYQYTFQGKNESASLVLQVEKK